MPSLHIAALRRCDRRGTLSAALLLGAASSLGACAGAAPISGPRAAPAPADRVVHTVLLVGDAGGAAADDPVLAAVRQAAAVRPDRTTVAYLGDNIYPRGLPPADAPARREAEARLRAQLEAARGASHVVFVAGNHDWDRHGGDGWSSVMRQGEFVEAARVPEARFLPGGGCPGPVALSLGDALRLIALDTQWWLQGDPKPRDPDSPCPTDSPAEVTAALRALVAADTARPVVVIAHHPLVSGGPHGGYFTWKDHLFPFTAWKHWLWVPLPLIGSAYPVARSLGITAQDMSSGRNRAMRDSLTAALQTHPPLVYAAGHEHNLQVLDGAAHGVHTLVVSGVGYFGHTTPVARLPQTRYARRASGFVRLDALDDGRVRLAVIVVDRDAEAREDYSAWLARSERAP